MKLSEQKEKVEKFVRIKKKSDKNFFRRFFWENSQNHKILSFS